MQLSGKITHVLEIESGESKKGTWQKRTIVIQNDNDKYPKPIAVQIWGELADTGFVVGDEITVSINIESREWNGKWFTDVRAWKIESHVQGGKPERATEPEPEDDGLGDLPF